MQYLQILQNLLRAAGAHQHAGHRAVPQHPAQRHGGKALAASGGQFVESTNLVKPLRRQLLGVEEPAICADAAVLRDAVQIPIGEQPLRQRAERNNALTQPNRGFFQTVLLDGTVKYRIAVLVDDEGDMQLVQNGGSLFQRGAVVVGKPRVQRPAALHGGGQRAHGLLQRGVRVHAVMVENVHIVQPHPLQALVQTGQQIFPAAPVSVRAVPHGIARLGGNDEFVPVSGQVVPQNTAEIPFRRAGSRPIVVGKVKVGDAVVKGGAHDGPHGVVAGGIPKIVPQTQRYGGKFQPAGAAAMVGHGRIAVRRGKIGGRIRHGKPPVSFGWKYVGMWRRWWLQWRRTEPLPAQ